MTGNRDLPGTSVSAAFQEWVRRTPDAVALSATGGTVSYAELAGWADRIAGRLVDAGVRPGDRVAVSLPRGAGLVAGLLGILRSGAAYVPTDLADPDRRVEQALRDAGVSAVVTDGASAARFAGVAGPLPWVDPAAVSAAGPAASRLPPAAGGTGADLAYLMYTSGSTGRPKAVMVEHRNIVNLVTDPNYVTLSPADRVLQFAPAAFDAATFEIWGALLNGAELVIAPPGPMSSAELASFVAATGVTVLWLTAALFHRQIDEDVEAFRRVRTVLAGGDVLSVPHVRALRAAAGQCQIVNGYGPTECTTFSCCHRIGPDEPLERSVPIGTPLQNVVVRILDGEGQQVPDGAIGELHIGGAGVARGYWGRPALTAERFVPDPFAAEPGRRFYRSGDLARRRPDGTLEFLGRGDNQVKLRGHRIEPGEVENVLTRHPDVRRAAVVLDRDHPGGPRLVGYVVPAHQQRPDTRLLRRYLRDHLPDHMVPAALVPLADLPITPNGKTDRAALVALAGVR